MTEATTKREMNLAPDRGNAVDTPFLTRADHAEPSVFVPQNLLREARRQRGLPNGRVPPVCLLDPDGDVVGHLDRTRLAAPSASWACYHTDLVEAEVEGLLVGVVGRAVGAPFAVLVAEELFASGCELVISITSAGKVAPDLLVPCVTLIDRALRGEGTSHAYRPAGPAVDADPAVVAAVASGLEEAGIEARRGTTWTTDAPYRETPTALAAAASAGAVAVEMEAAGLYAFAAARRRPLVCFAHVTNALAVAAGDFEKGPSDGAEQAMAIVAAAARGWLASRQG